MSECQWWITAFIGTALLTAAVVVSGLEPEEAPFWIMGVLLMGSHFCVGLLGTDNG